MRYKRELEEKLGQAVLAELRRLVRNGTIGVSRVKDMSYDYNMNVNTVYNDSRDKEEDIDLTMKQMLDRWCEITVCTLSPSVAQNKLLEILTESNCSNLAVNKIRQLCGAEESQVENSGTFKGNNNDRLIVFSSTNQPMGVPSHFAP